MKKAQQITRKIVSAILATVIMLTAAPLSGFTDLDFSAIAELFRFEAKAEYVDSGTCGDNLTWTLDDEGTLTISGNGAMTDWSSTSFIPWYYYCSSIKKVTIDNGVTRIGD